MGTDEPPPLEDVRVIRARACGIGRFTDVLDDIGAGRGLAAHRRLLALRKKPLNQSDRQAIDAALADPRLFVEPAGKRAGLGRLNGFGTGLYGSSHYDRSDGSYVVTRCASALWIPFFPIDQWLVRSADGGGRYFLGRVPLTPGVRRLRALSVATMAAVALIVAIAVVWGSTHSTLHLVSGLDMDATVTIDDEQSVLVPAKGRSSVGVASGSRHFRCIVAGRTIDDRTASVSGTADLVVYNVAGSAPLCVEDVVYTKETARADAKPPRPSYQILAGSVFAQREDAEDVFTEPPDSVELSSSEKRKVRHHAFVDRGGWRRAVELLEDDNETARAADVAEAVALAQPNDAALVDECVTISKSVRPPKEHGEFLDRLNAAKAGASR
jgi:hypothetical protein